MKTKQLSGNTDKYTQFFGFLHNIYIMSVPMCHRQILPPSSTWIELDRVVAGMIKNLSLSR
jgi:hypothetical protein